MTTSDDVLRRFREADPARAWADSSDDDVPPPIDTLLEDADTAVSTDISLVLAESGQPSTRYSGRRRVGWLVAAAAVVLVAMIGVIEVLRSDVEPGHVDEPSEEGGPISPPPSLDEAIEAAGDYLAAYASGDPDVVAALEADDIRVRVAPFRDDLHEPAIFDPLSGPMLAATGVEFVDPSCVPDAVTDRAVVVSCRATMRMLEHRTLNGGGVGVDITLSIGADGVIAFDSTHRAPVDGVVGVFDEFAAANCADVERPSEDASVRDVGRARVRCARAWAETSIASARQVISRFNAGDLDAYLADWVETRLVFGPDNILDEELAVEVIAAQMASGMQLAPTACTPVGSNTRSDVVEGMIVRCDVEIVDDLSAVTGATTSGDFRWVIDADGRFGYGTANVDWTPFSDFAEGFEQWLAAHHPGVHDSIEWIHAPGGPYVSADDRAEIDHVLAEYLTARSDDTS